MTKKKTKPIDSTNEEREGAKQHYLNEKDLNSADAIAYHITKIKSLKEKV